MHASKQEETAGIMEGESMGRLKPCPFCGSKDVEEYIAHPQYVGKPEERNWCYWAVGCPECGVWIELGYTPPRTLEDAHIEAVETWNRRVSDGKID